jgi:uncharacterized OB-fold protein
MTATDVTGAATGASIGRARPVDPGLFARLDPPRLAGSRCADCGTVVFPAASGCPRCSGSAVERVELPDVGRLWSWTVQHFEPKPPYVVPEEGFTPFPVGYVDLGDVLVEARLVGEPGAFGIGAAVRLVLLPLPPAASEIDPVVTYAFALNSAGSDSAGADSASTDPAAPREVSGR